MVQDVLFSCTPVYYLVPTPLWRLLDWTAEEWQKFLEDWLLSPCLNRACSKSHLHHSSIFFLISFFCSLNYVAVYRAVTNSGIYCLCSSCCPQCWQLAIIVLISLTHLDILLLINQLIQITWRNFGAVPYPNHYWSSLYMTCFMC